MTDHTDFGSWQQICTVERVESASWLVEELRHMLPSGTQFKLQESGDGYVDVLCSPPLTEEALQLFEQRFDARNFTDAAFLSS